MILYFQVNVIRDGNSWIVRAYCPQISAWLPDFCVEGATEAEAFAEAARTLSEMECQPAPIHLDGYQPSSGAESEDRLN